MKTASLPAQFCQHKLYTQGELRPTRKRLGTSLERGYDLARTDTLAGCQVSKKELEISVEISEIAWGYKRKDCSVAVWSRVELPLMTCNGRSGDWRTGLGNWSCSTVGSQPDHDLVVIVRANGRCKPQIVRYVSHEVGTGVSTNFSDSRLTLPMRRLTYLQVHVDGMDEIAESFLLTVSRATFE